MNIFFIAILVFAVAMVVSMLAYPRVLKFAKSHNFVDNPNARKLQRVPVPVMGGMVVYLGALFGVLTLSIFRLEPMVIWGVTGMSVLLVIGMMDDMMSLSAALRFTIELAIIALFIWQTDIYIDDFHGLWGIHKLEPWFAYALSIWSGVCIINAINMIDGVDGYSSGYGMLTCFCYALVFLPVSSQVMVCLTMIMAGALLPFFMHNVFGIRTKMFIGDSGTMMLGMMMTMFVFYGVSSKGRCASLEADGVGLAAMTVAIMCIPVFDSLRVALMRVFRGYSPFKPDKTHLHHLFIEMGFSHLGAAASILTLNIIVVLTWLLSWKLGASVDVQMYVVLAMGTLVTFVFYKVMKIQQNGGPKDEEGYPQGTWLWHAFCRLGRFSHREKGRVWRYLRWRIDHKGS